MNKSVEFIKNRIKNGYVTGFPIEGWDSSHTINPILRIRNLLTIPDSEIRKFVLHVNNRVITTEYNNKTGFDYFCSQTVSYDGTFIFVDNAINEMLLSILTGATYKKDLISKYYLTEPSKYNIRYTIGDIVINNEYKYNPTRTTSYICLPIKFVTEDK